MKNFISKIKPVNFQSLNWAVVVEKDGKFYCYFESELGLHTAQEVNKKFSYDDLSTLKEVEKKVSRKGSEYFVYKK